MLPLDTLVRYSLATSLAYLPPDRLGTGTEPYALRLAPHLQFAEQVTVDALSASCTLFHGPDELVIAFRGSTQFRNYLSMFNLRFVRSCLGGVDGLVHTGYQDASLKLYERLAPILEQRACPRLVFLGHSYGGGTATMCAALHSASTVVDDLVTFAGPRVGDAAFAASFDRRLGKRTTHLVNDLDPVLAQNQPLWNALGFVHTGTVVRCSASKPQLLDEGAPREGLPLNFADHALYLGTRLGLDPLGLG